ncbi:MAG: DNA repair protein RecN [Alphaproteobacteria bacterium]
MLANLTIQNFVLIDYLEVSFSQGLCLLTGETGAGKSILLDALGFSLGGRGHQRFVRAGHSQASVSAEFSEVSSDIISLLDEHGLSHDDTMILRRQLNADGRSRAFINDQPVSVGLLKMLGQQLVEIHGQFDRLLDASSHRMFLDDYGDLQAMRQGVSDTFTVWEAARNAWDDWQQRLQTRQERLEMLTRDLEDFDTLSPVQDEEPKLDEERAILAHREKFVGGYEEALERLQGESGAESALNQAYRSVERLREMAEDKISPIMEALDKSTVELNEALALLEQGLQEMDPSGTRLSEIEERLYNLRALARKHNTTVDELPNLWARLQQELQDFDQVDERSATLKQELDAAQQAYDKVAGALSAARQKAAAKLDKAMQEELPPLKLERATFKTAFTQTEPTESGVDRVAFTVSTNTGAAFGDLSTIASGGERARFMLALKALLAQTNAVPTLVFDEVDSGVSGAVARAVGERLQALSGQVQILVITHSPQVASMGHHHWRVAKHDEGGATITNITKLSQPERLEEIARMLSGADVTVEARAAAEKLLVSA